MNLSQLMQTDAIGDVLLLQLCGSVSSLADHGILTKLDEIRQQRREIGLNKLIVDLEQAPFFGSSLLEVIRVLWNDVSAEGGRMVLCSPSPVGRDVLQIAKFDQVWPVVETRKDALDLINSEREIAGWPSALQALLSKYEHGPQQLRNAISGISAIQIRTPTPPGNWSILQIVCHIADFELVYADRLKRVIAEERPTLFGGDPDVFAAKLAYIQRDLEVELSVISAVRRQVARILKTLSVTDFKRVGQHSVDGALSLNQLLERIAGHIPHHVQFIEGKKTSFAV
jgi:anti-anti-sigma factor